MTRIYLFPRIALIFTLLLATLVRFVGIDAKPLWNDEAFSIRVALQPVPEVISLIAADVHPPIYYLLLHLWLWIVPSDETGRLLSALFGVAAILAVYALARGVVTRWQAVVAATICAILPYYVSWAQISRAYGLLTFVSVLALLASAQLLCRLAEAKQSSPATGWRRAMGGGAPIWTWGVIYVAAGAAALWTHNIAAFLLLGINAAAAWRVLTGQLRGPRSLAIWSACQITILVIWAPWLPTVLEQTTRLGAPQFLVTPADVVGRIALLLGDFMLWKIGGIAAAIGLAGAVLGALRIDWRSAHAQVVLSSVLVPPLACVVLFVAGKPSLGYSVANLIWIPALLAMLLSANLRIPPRGRHFGAVLGAILVFSFFVLAARGLHNWRAAPNPAWDRVAAHIAAGFQPGDVLVATATITAPDDAAGDVPMHALALYWASLGAGERQLPGPARPPVSSDEDLSRWMAQHQRLWIPRFVPMADTTPSMRVVALAERDPARWSVTHETIQRLGITRVTRIRTGGE